MLCTHRVFLSWDLADERMVLLAANSKKQTGAAGKTGSKAPSAKSATPASDSSPDKSRGSTKPTSKSQTRAQAPQAKAALSDHKYCIIGAGPGGLQLGQFMSKAGRDFVTFEKNPKAASFFESFPIHRRLTSLNKRFTGRSDAMFNMRHDWNSLLETSVPPVTSRTEDRFPLADVLVDYLRDFAAEQEAEGRIAYGTEVTKIKRGQDGQSFSLKLSSRGGFGAVETTTSCGCVVIAQGLQLPSIPDGWDEVKSDGRTLTQGYEELPSHGRDYENRSVAVFGMSNDAFEAADAIAPYAQYEHVFRASTQKQTPLVSWESRYEGDLRAVNAQLLDSYVLKSLDGGFAANGPNGETSVVLPCAPLALSPLPSLPHTNLKSPCA